MKNIFFFFQYFMKTWHEKYSPSIWIFKNQNQINFIRTNNALECYNRRIG
ncbi:hypothetical protein MXB_3628 [Myxobolus squamalis]|nr:hypothetical protein MXB_3628 [Myxobolus squamalis]